MVLVVCDFMNLMIPSLVIVKLLCVKTGENDSDGFFSSFDSSDEVCTYICAGYKVMLSFH